MSVVLLDTHLLIWGSDGSKRLKSATKKRIIEADSVYFSAASIAEIAITFALGKLSIDPDWMIQSALEGGFFELPVNSLHAAHVAKLDPIHHNPFDRLLIAQAHIENMKLLTADKILAAYGPCVEVV